MAGGLLNRWQLFDRLHDEATRLAVLSAPSGFGKTTLVRSWVATLEPDQVQVVWVPLTAPVSDVHEFWSRVGAGLLRFGVVEDSGLLEALEVGLDAVAAIGRALAGRRGRVVLVVDAYEHALPVADPVDEGLRRLVAGDPLLRLVLTTRGGSSLTSPVGRLASGVDVIDEADLAFSRAETVELLAEGVGMDEAAATAVHVDTRGYPLAVRAVALGMRHTLGPRSQPADWRTVVADVFLDQMPPAAREFLMETTIPPYFDVALASRLLPGTDAEQTLRSMEVAGLGRWIPYSPSRTVFQYADAVRDAVRQTTARMDPTSFHRSCGLSSVWLRELGEDDAALELAVAGQRYDLATAVTRGIMLRNPLSYMTDHYDKILLAVPRTQLAKYPVLAFARGLAALTSVATRAAAVDYLGIVARWVDSETAGRTAGERLFDYTIRVISLRLLGQFADAASAAGRALALDAADPNLDSEGLVELRPMVLRHLAYSLFQAGEVDVAIESMARATTSAVLPWSRNQTLSYGAGMLAIAGRRREADIASAAIDPLAWAPGQEFTFVNALGRVAAATSLLDDFDFGGAVREYDQCEPFLDTAEFWPFVTWTLVMARLGMGEASSEAGRVDERLRTTPPPPGSGANLGTAALLNALAILWLCQGRQSRAAALLATGTPCVGQLAPGLLLRRLMAGDPVGALNVVSGMETMRGHTIRSRAAVVTLGAAAALRTDNEPLALSLLQRAASLHLAHGARAHLIWVPDLDLAEMRQLAKESGDQRIIGYLDFSAQARIVSGATSEPLSEREQVVLEMMVRWRTRQEIAGALQVSTNTVKTQMQSIYRKFGVTSRAAAIERAVELDLLAGKETGSRPGAGRS